MQILEAPVFRNQPRGQPVEQFRMRWRCPEFTKVAGISGKTASEMLLPEAVDDDTRGELIVCARDPARECRAATCGLQASMSRCDMCACGIK